MAMPLKTLLSVLPGDIQGPTPCTATCKCTKTQFSCRTVTRELLLKKRKERFPSRGRHSTLTKVVSKVYKCNRNTQKHLRITIRMYLWFFPVVVGGKRDFRIWGQQLQKTQVVSASNIHHIPARDGQGMPMANSRLQHERRPQSTFQPSCTLTPPSPKQVEQKSINPGLRAQLQTSRLPAEVKELTETWVYLGVFYVRTHTSIYLSEQNTTTIF